MNFFQNLFALYRTIRWSNQPHETPISEYVFPETPKDVIDEIARVAVSEYDQAALFERVKFETPQVARALVLLSEGSIGHLEMLFRENDYLRSDFRDVLSIAHELAPYDAGYFIDSFPVIKKRKRKTPARRPPWDPTT